jgi:hypothetical protein
VTNDSLRPIVKSQYHASLAMLKDAIEKCPDDVWLDDRVTNRFWQIAYHVLYYTHLYLHVDEKSATRWAGHQEHVQYPSALTNPRLEVDASLPKFAAPYSKAQVLELWAICDGLVNDAVDSFDLDSPDCGFWWYKMGKLEHQFINIRHIQHHAAQLADRLRVAKNVGVPWVGMRH